MIATRWADMSAGEWIIGGAGVALVLLLLIAGFRDWGM